MLLHKHSLHCEKHLHPSSEVPFQKAASLQRETLMPVHDVKGHVLAYQ
jgi:hypothetical protein